MKEKWWVLIDDDHNNTVILIIISGIFADTLEKKVTHKDDEISPYGPARIPARKYVEHSKPVQVDSKLWKKKNIENKVDELVDLTFGVRQENLDHLKQIVEDVSNPDSAKYGQYLKFDEVKDIVKPNPENLDAIMGWLGENSVINAKVMKTGDFIRATVPVSKAEELLAVRYSKFQSKIATDVSFYRSTDPYSVPSHLVDKIDFIGGVNHLPTVPKQKNTDATKGSNKYLFPHVTPQVIYDSLNMSNAPTTRSKMNGQAIAQFLEEYYSPSDFDIFQRRFGMPKQDVSNIVGPNVEDNPGMETALDIQYITAVAPNINTWIVSLPGRHEGQEPFLDWLIDMADMKDLPWVHSISYGDDENTIDPAYTKRVDVEFQKYAAMGRTMLFASGDSGTGCDKACKTYVPNWPTSSPYVLSVGGVVYKGVYDMDGDQISGGGFSNYFSSPPYQLDHVQNYFDQINGSYPYHQSNLLGRGYPDVSCYSEHLVIVHNRRFIIIGGTSASTPIVAGLISLINEERFNANKPPVGFINPLLYKIAKDHPDAFKDIQTGENQNGCCQEGYHCKEGWDPVTGLGVPNFNKLLKYAMDY
ncbi:peptidase S8 and S53 domain-containing protein [Cavenderia fasciculata]|uniref:Peptidase S8 and S53 domain-containing protein n=1 Tax=Cavenderia fasciculata TaxID=261658 RepID=F4QBZ4_CACFS|nr:peptidase S8 and S53 domain-containing protein [Cavenderia fasciculata]EGG14732.1 peptidase S8 and S53 domain-containing protein [Cavenderia fasciculata]|eukprot:XP_004351240.1 peptidase S8 and S53 domain-containing protein [Cavenderia fasciculata]